MANQAAQTAYGPMSIVVAEQYYPDQQRLVQDKLALHFLPPGLKILARLARWSPVRNLIFNLSETRARGIWGGVLCRKRYIDDKLLEAASDGLQAVVILGAGLDTRAYRPAILGTLPVFEVDLPENIAYKRAKLQAVYGGLPAHVALVPLDFDHQDLMSGLGQHGYQAEYKSFFIWEAVTQYLSQAGVQKTLRSLAQAKAGSRLVFTYICQDFIDGTDHHGLEALYAAYRGKNPLWHFGLAPGQVATFLEPCSWKELEQVGSQEYTARYLEPVGRTMPVTEIERAVYAEKR